MSEKTLLSIIRETKDPLAVANAIRESPMLALEWWNIAPQDIEEWMIEMFPNADWNWCAVWFAPFVDVDYVKNHLSYPWNWSAMLVYHKGYVVDINELFDSLQNRFKQVTCSD